MLFYITVSFLEKCIILVYNVNKARFLSGVFTGGYARLTYTGRYAESMKGGVLMKSKHIADGKKIAFCNFGNYLFTDDFIHKSTIAALCQGRLL